MRGKGANVAQHPPLPAKPCQSQNSHESHLRQGFRGVQTGLHGRPGSMLLLIRVWEIRLRRCCCCCWPGYCCSGQTAFVCAATGQVFRFLIHHSLRGSPVFWMISVIVSRKSLLSPLTWVLLSTPAGAAITFAAERSVLAILVPIPMA